jgi:hypothetical protein
VKSEKTFDYPTMEGAAIYRIRVRGRLNTDLSDRLEGMHIENLQSNDGKAESVLEGSILDQAALAGVLNKLYELHLPVMTVVCLGDPKND